MPQCLIVFADPFVWASQIKERGIVRVVLFRTTLHQKISYQFESLFVAFNSSTDVILLPNCDAFVVPVVSISEHLLSLKLLQLLLYLCILVKLCGLLTCETLIEWICSELLLFLLHLHMDKWLVWVLLIQWHAHLFNVVTLHKGQSYPYYILIFQPL